MILARLVQYARLGESLPPLYTNEQRLCRLFVLAGMEAPGGRPLSWGELRLLTRWPDNSIRKALGKLLTRGCVTHFTRRGVYVLNFDGQWPEDGRGKAPGSVEARKRNPQASRPFSVNTMRGLV